MSRERIQRSGDSALVLPGEGPPADRLPVAVLVHLSGRWRGSIQRLRGDGLRIGTDEQAEVRVSPEPSVARHHATLRRQPGGGFELSAEPDCPLWVNGEPTRRRELETGDVLEIGRDGPLLRYRLYPPGSRPSRSLAEAFADGFDGASPPRRAGPRRAAAGVAGAVREVATRAPLWFRLATIVALLALAGSVVALVVRGRSLERRLARETLRIEGLSELVERGRPGIAAGELAAVRGELAAAVERVEALETRSGAIARLVAAAAPAVALLQGSYGFVDPASGEPLRLLGLDADGLPLRDGAGQPVVGFGGAGPPVEVFFTGSAFVARSDGLLLTNRHLAVPWRDDAAALRAIGQGLRPEPRRLIAYLPGHERAFEARPHLVSESADLALLSSPGLAGLAAPLALRGGPPEVGEEVVVLGYPAGIPALLARSDERFLELLMRGGRLDFWRAGAELARSGQIGPLASRGIVAQVGRAAVVYDAETTQGGSGGPVLGIDGEVVAVTSAVVTEFGGSNLGVPTREARRLLLRAAVRRLLVTPLR